MHPEMGTQERSGIAVSAVSKVFLGSNLGSNAVKVSKGTRVAHFEANEVARPLRGNEKVVRESSGRDLEASHVPRPR